MLYDYISINIFFGPSEVNLTIPFFMQLRSSIFIACNSSNFTSVLPSCVHLGIAEVIVISWLPGMVIHLIQKMQRVQ